MNDLLGLAGSFTLTTRKVVMKDGAPVYTSTGEPVWADAPVVRAEFTNLILNSGLDSLGYRNPIGGVVVGSGTSIPAISQTSLDQVVAVTNIVQSSQPGIRNTSPPYLSRHTWTYRFDVGAAAGNLTEVGVGWDIYAADNIGGLFSRSLIKDVSGNPIAITILSDEVLDVAYSLQLQPPQTDVSGQVDIGGVTYNYTIRAANVNSGIWAPSTLGGDNFKYAIALSGGLEDITGQPQGSGSVDIQSVRRTYIAGSYQHIYDLPFNLNAGNVAGGVRSIYLTTNFGEYQISFSNASTGETIPKDNTKILNIPFVVSWGRTNVL